MKKAILATKVGMTQIFNEDGVLTPVTVLQAGVRGHFISSAPSADPRPPRRPVSLPE